MREYIVNFLSNDINDCVIHEPVVRCRDCSYYGSYDGSSWCCRTYEHVSSGTCDYQTVELNGFCAWGERK